jgi:hypothetical protein
LPGPWRRSEKIAQPLIVILAPPRLISPENAIMALVVRIDTWQRIGYFTDLKGPLPAGASGSMFDAWRHPDGSLRHEPPSLPFEADGSLERFPPIKLSIPVHNPAAADLELMVSPTYLDFILHHPAFHPFPPRRWRRNRLSTLIGCGGR